MSQKKDASFIFLYICDNLRYTVTNSSVLRSKEFSASNKMCITGSKHKIYTEFDEVSPFTLFSVTEQPTTYKI